MPSPSLFALLSFSSLRSHPSIVLFRYFLFLIFSNLLPPTLPLFPSSFPSFPLLLPLSPAPITSSPHFPPSLYLTLTPTPTPTHTPVLTQRSDLGYQIDGAVVKVNNRQHQELFGMGSRSPKWALAFKYSAEEVEAELLR